MDTAQDWLSRLTAYGYFDLGGHLIVLILIAALLWDFERLFRAHRDLVVAVYGNDETPGMRQELDDLKRSTEQSADTGPIALDRPSPAQIASPTRPDLEAQKPPVSSGGRHRATAA